MWSKIINLFKKPSKKVTLLGLFSPNIGKPCSPCPEILIKTINAELFYSNCKQEGVYKLTLNLHITKVDTDLESNTVTGTGSKYVKDKDLVNLGSTLDSILKCIKKELVSSGMYSKEEIKVIKALDIDVSSVNYTLGSNLALYGTPSIEFKPNVSDWIRSIYFRD